MSRKFIATIVAAAMTVTAVSSAPARADDDFVKLIMGAAAIYALSQTVKKDRPRVSTNSHEYPPAYRPDLRPRPLPDRARKAKPIPAHCLKYVESRRGDTVRLLGQRCLNRHYRHVHRLPERCETKVRTRNGVRHGYKPRCVRKHGFRLAQY
ncbi:hypothetical protein [Shimia sediminis]|uniref:hypothetical protein n=1 Tax=Shimia sediminis TaxID=2497945 RepID=UPI000F8EA0A3|nr:hypothetical protein [Shimia sediminis]